MIVTTMAPATTLRELFAVTPQSLAPTIKISLDQTPVSMGKEKLAQWKSIEQSPHFAELVGEHMCGFLMQSVAGILAGAWHTYHEVRSAANETLADPALHSEITLSDHDFSYDMSPTLDLLLGGFKLCEIELTLAARFNLCGLALSIRHGCVEGVRSGKADCALVITCSRSTVFAHTLAAVDLPGMFRLSEPLLLADRPAHAVESAIAS